MVFVSILVVVLFILIFDLRSRVTKLEKQHTAETVASTPLAHPVVSSPSTPSRPETVNLPVSSVTFPSEATPASSTDSSYTTSFDPLEWLKQDWLLKLGGLLVLLALGWFVSYAFIHNWIGPAARIALGLFLGILLLIIGWERMHTHLHQGGIFLVLGSGTIILTLYAARLVYGFFTPVSALFLMFLSAVVVAGASVRYRYEPLAYLGLLLASTAPFFVVSPQQDYFLLFSYLFVVVLGTAWLLFQTRVRGLSPLTLLIVFFYSLPHFARPHLPETEALLFFAFAFVALLFLMNIVSTAKDLSFPVPLTMMLVGGNTVLLIAWILVAAPSESQSLFLVLWMGILVGVTLLMRYFTERSEVFLSHTLAVVGLLAAATAVEFDGPILTIAYIVEGLFSPIIVWLLSKNIRHAGCVSLVILWPLLLSLESMHSAAWLRGIWHDDFFVLLLLSISLFALGSFFRLKSPLSESEAFRLGSFYLITGSLVGYVLLWLSLHAVFLNESMATFISYLIYTVIGILFYIQGRTVGRRGWKQYGGALVIFVVGRLLLVDVWQMELGGRIITFFIIGVLLMSTAFLERKHRELPQ